MGVTNPSLIGLLLVARDVFFILSPSLLVGLCLMQSGIINLLYTSSYFS